MINIKPVALLTVREVDDRYEFRIVLEDYNGLTSEHAYEAISQELYRYSKVNLMYSTFVDREDSAGYNAKRSNEQDYPNDTSFRVRFEDGTDVETYDVDVSFGFLIEGKVYSFGSPIEVDNDYELYRM